MFAFAVWDPRVRRLFAARDRLGIKPLYYRWHSGTLTFASELKAILVADPMARPGIDARSFDRYLRLQYVPAPHTMVEGVRQLRPGSTLALAMDGHEPIEQRYWHARAKSAGQTTSSELHERLAAVVKSHMVADVPVGALLSGGLDSSLIVAHMVRASATPVHTFSVGFEDERLDERPAARRVATHLGTVHHEQLVTDADAAEALPRIVAAMDEPLADYAALPTYLVARFAACHVKVVLTGEGADELFAGYRRYRRDRLLAPIARLRPSYQPSHVFSARETSRLLGRRPSRLERSEHGHRRTRDTLNQLLLRDVEGWLPDDLLVKVDRMTMLCSLEARVPYLDHEFVEYALGIPASRKLQSSERREQAAHAGGRLDDGSGFDRRSARSRASSRRSTRGSVAGCAAWLTRRCSRRTRASVNRWMFAACAACSRSMMRDSRMVTVSGRCSFTNSGAGRTVSPERPVAYVLGTFPQASQTFIAREIRGLRQLDVPLLVFALGRRDAGALEEPDRAWYGEVRFAPLPFGWATLASNLHFIVRAPGLYWRTLISLVTLRHRPRVLALRAFALMLTGAWIAREIERAGGCRQVHAHFALAQTEVAMAVSGLLGCPFSFTAHARDIYAHAKRPRGEDPRRCRGRHVHGLQRRLPPGPVPGYSR